MTAPTIQTAIPRLSELRGHRLTIRWRVHLLRLLVLVVMVAGWQFLPKIDRLSQRYRFLDDFFISSPSEVAKRIRELALAESGSVSIWPYLATTMKGALIGSAVGLLSGFAVGLILSNSRLLNDVFGVFIMAANAIPRIALVPLIIVLVGPGTEAAVVTSTIVVFFVTFYVAFEGGRRVPAVTVDNARIMGASSARIMFRVRMPFVMLWTFASVPNALALSLIVTVTSEILAGRQGVGVLLLTATANLDSTTTMAVIVFLSVTGVALLRGAEIVKRRVLHWAEET